MPIFIRVRLAAFRLARALRRSILEKGHDWEIDADRRGRPILTAGPFRILIVPRAIRLFDALHLYCDDTEVWLPLVARLRLRNAVRLVILRHALQCVPAPELDRGQKPISGRKRAVRAQTE